MVEPPAELTDSPIDFGTAVAYALQPEMRRLIILYVVGVLMVPLGLELFLEGGLYVTLLGLLTRLIGLVLTVIGATLLFGGLIGAAFKLVTDANRTASTT